MSDELRLQQNSAPLWRYQSLLTVSETLAAQRDLASLFNALAEHLRTLVEFDAIVTSLYDPARDLMHVQMHAVMARETSATTAELFVEASTSAWVLQTQQPLLIADMQQAEPFPELVQLAQPHGLRSYCLLPLRAVGRWLGALGFGSTEPARYADADLKFLQQVANQVAVAVDNALKFEDTRAAEQKLRLLLEVNNSVVSHLDLQELFKAIAACLRQVIEHDAARLTLFDAASNKLRILALDSQTIAERPISPGGLVPIEDTPAGLAFTERRAVLVGRRDLDQFTSPIVQRLRATGINSGLIAPLLLHGRALGTLDLASLKDGAFTEADAELLSRIADQIAIAVENALNFERARKAEQEVRRQFERERLILEINNAIVSQLNLRDLVRVVSTCLREVLHPDVIGLSLYDAETDQLRAYVFDLSGALPAIEEGTPIPFKGSAGGAAFLAGRPVFFGRTDAARAPQGVDRKLIEAGIKSGGCVPLLARGRKLGVLGVGSFREQAFSEADQELLSHIANQIALAVENALAYREIETLKNKLTEEKLYLEEEINTNYSF